MTGTLQRADDYQERKKKKEEQSPSPASGTPSAGNAEPPTPSVNPTQTTEGPNQSVISETAPDFISPVKEGMDAGLQKARVLPENPIGESYIDWRKLSWDDAAKANPNLSLSKYISDTAAYRRENGMEDYTDAELTALLKGRNPYETEAERQKREKRLRRAEILNGVGSVLGNLVNYVRARNGNVAMNLSDGTEGYNRIERIRQGQQQLARTNAQDYLGAITRERAERAKKEAAEVARAQRERDYRFKEAELRIKIENARSERERKAAENELSFLKFRHQMEMDAAKLKETQRNHQAQEAVSWYRAKNGSGSNKYLELETSEGKKRYTPGEHGTNWVHKAYQDMLKEPDGKSFAVKKAGGPFGSSTPSEQEMYEAITKYNESQWKNRYKRGRNEGGGTEIPPLD